MMDPTQYRGVTDDERILAEDFLAERYGAGEGDEIYLDDVSVYPYGVNIHATFQRGLDDREQVEIWILDPAAAALMQNEFTATPAHGRVFDEIGLWGELLSGEIHGVERCLSFMARELSDVYADDEPQRPFSPIRGAGK